MPPIAKDRIRIFRHKRLRQCVHEDHVQCVVPADAIVSGDEMQSAFHLFANEWEKCAPIVERNITEIVGEFFKKVVINVTANDKFRQLSKRWMSETSHLSRLDQVYIHPAYQQIIGMGQEALPFIFAELHKPAGRWYWALKSITGYEPFSGESGIPTEKMKSAWLEWGRKHGYA